ncbi:DUF1707 SHOCT-like domain-containing protein [Actinomadura parmotrematis]|uniref:DUF1707 domain-containing protein n=1 Tax=Actinomadura parmotrematis TaxID=2864039 RepID=A0ABS7FV65_9ACTN|nr:DUF1707 domain-containing protein [Actinomadura parmotrematis]MBW8484311.1 DUF1707 domain-containing protein [Actinomadura parmotrematis]
MRAPDILASDRDRDDLLVRLHTAFAEGRLAEAELDDRIDRTLAARTHGDLADISADLPEAASPRPAGGAPARSPGRFQLAYKSGLRRTGRWRLPERQDVVVYKGTGLLDLRGAELDAQVTTLRVLAYKSDVRIVVPPGLRVEAGGTGVSSELHGAPGPDAPVVVVRGLAYKGAIEIGDRPAAG